MKALLLCCSLLCGYLCIAQNVYYPIKPGTTYEMRFGEMYAQMSNSHARTVITEDTKEIDGKTYTVVESQYGDGTNFKSVMKQYVRTDQGGNVWIASDYEKKAKLSFPAADKLTKNYRWEVTIAGVTTEHRVLTTDGTFTIPGGKTFRNCLVVEQSQDGKPITRTYTQREVGPVSVCMLEDGQEKLMLYLSDKF
ncbi:MAG: hypothetical protein AAFZ52_06210 [Bacteroidota bacterium]